MSWMAVLFWLAAILSIVQWSARWRLAGGFTVRRFSQECYGNLGNMQGPMLLAGLFALVVLPFSVAFDFIPPTLIPLQVPLALTAILSTTGPVSFLVLGPSRGETSETCGKLNRGFILLRAGAAVDPVRLGAVLHHELGPSGNLWMGAGGRPWQYKVAQMIESAPLVIFDARVINRSTRWEFFHLLTTGQLAKTIVVGPVGERGLAMLLRNSNFVPIIEIQLLCEVAKAGATRAKLLKWYTRRRYAIRLALQNFREQPRPEPTEMEFETWLYITRLHDCLHQVISMYDLPLNHMKASAD
jgi:hypothetical protein